MLVLLGLLNASYLNLNVGRTPVGNAEKWSVDIPFSVYLDWITVATIANITDYLYLINWNGFGIAPQVWAVIMLIVTSLIALATIITRRDTGFVLVLVWAFIDIAVKQVDTPLVAGRAWAAAFFALALAISASFNVEGFWYSERSA